MKSIILFGHGARDQEWAQPLIRLQAVVCKRLPDTDVRLAFLEFMAPTLDLAIDSAVQAGADHVAVVPVFLAQGGHVKRDVPNIVEAARLRHPKVVFTLRPALGELDRVIEALAEGVILG
ncbi:sirohydrochlorin chelatase [Uliginosibacterium gangwonense]|uniref:sirohydrochlorin chelatase n=1 Tax=Uliginosibacterium gangwonense TaxID=392736 RepID=UPI00037878F6|nr:CbiX/SirB N-terminal domain-containing protein [Uliginosibacterium gangwonense]